MFQSFFKFWIIILFSTLLIVGGFGYGSTAAASDITAIDQKIQSSIARKDFDQALELISQKTLVEQNTFDQRFLKARILSWKGDHRAARRALDTLMADFPGNDDVTFASGNLEYYQGNLKKADAIFTDILQRNPNYTDVAVARENVRKAQRTKRPYNWRIDGGAGLSSFDETDLNNWNNQYLRAEYTPDNVAYHAKVQNYRRFGQNNVQFEAGIADAKREDWDWGLAAGFTPSADFRPEFHIGGRVGRKIKLDNGPTLVTTLHYRYDQYTEAKIHNISPEVTAYFQNGSRLTGRVINTVQSNESDQTGWLVSGSYPVSKKWTLNGGYAKAPEAVDNPNAIDSLVVTTKSIFGGVSYAVSPQLDLHVNVVRDDRQDTYIRNAVNVGFTQKF